MVVSTYRSISLKVVGSTMGVFMGEAYRFKAPKLIFCYSKAKYLENRTKSNAKTANVRNPKLPDFLWLRPGPERGVRVYAAPGPGFVAGTRGRLNFRNVLSFKRFQTKNKREIRFWGTHLGRHPWGPLRLSTPLTTPLG